jgi:NAD(P)-dependent dehydrogenase (short-subunit alcohol dehydrogenase family)
MTKAVALETAGSGIPLTLHSHTFASSAHRSLLAMYLSIYLRGCVCVVCSKGITINAVCPGWVLTPLVQQQIDARAKAKGVSLLMITLPPPQLHYID